MSEHANHYTTDAVEIRRTSDFSFREFIGRNEDNREKLRSTFTRQLLHLTCPLTPDHIHLYVTIYQFIYKKSEIGKLKVVSYTSGKIWSARLIFLFFLAVCLNISTVINIKILANYNQQTQSYKFTSHIAAFLSVALITEMLEICIQTSYDQNVQLILKSYLHVVYGTP